MERNQYLKTQSISWEKFVTLTHSKQRTFTTLTELN